jgi:hypothetical protein
MLYSGDEKQHNNPDLAYVDANFIRGGGRVTANLSTLLTDFASKTDQLKENITTVYVISEGLVYRLKSIANIGTLATGWKKETVDLSQGAKIGATNTLTGLPAFEFTEGGDTNSELVFGTATVTGQVLKAIGFRAGGDRGQNGAPMGRFPLRMELNYGIRWCLPGTNANVGGKNHFGVYQANGSSEIIYVDNEGTIRMTVPAQDAGSSDYIAIIGTDGTLKKMSQTALRRPYRGTFTTIAALQATPGQPGDYATLDTGPGVDAVSYIYDTSDNVWVPSTLKTASTFLELGGNPADNPALAFALNSKVDKVTGKGLSTNDFTDTFKTMLDTFTSNVLGVLLTGISFLDSTAVTTADSIKTAIGKLQAQINKKQDAVSGKGLSTEDYTTAEKSKLGAILSGFNILFTAPRRDLPAVYLDKAAKVTAITLNGASALSYSINGGTSYITPSLPITTATTFALPVGFVKFRITYMSNVTDATAYLRFE